MFAFRMFRVDEIDVKPIIKSGHGFFEGDTVLCQVPGRFVIVPIERHFLVFSPGASSVRFAWLRTVRQHVFSRNEKGKASQAAHDHNVTDCREAERAVGGRFLPAG
jgi:hypothetical protein